MAKRKRDTEESKPAQWGRSKKVKRQMLDGFEADIVAESCLQEKPVLGSDEVVKQPETEEKIALARKSKKQERKKLKRKQHREQQTEPQAQGSAEKPERRYGSLTPVQMEGRKELKQRKEMTKGESLKSVENGDFEKVTARKETKEKQEKWEKKEKKKDQQEKRERQKKENNKMRGDEDLTWKISDPIGGHMLDCDPVFSRDEKFLLVAYDAAIAVYSTSTSLLVRHLRINKADNITAFAFSSSSNSQVYISTISGGIEKWDWSDALRLGHWKLSSSIYSVMTSTQNMQEIGSELVYTVDRQDGGPWLITAHRLANEGDIKKTDVKTLLNYQESLSFVNIIDSGRFVVATSGSQLILGNTDLSNPYALQDLSYTWRIVECPEWIISIGVRVTHPERVVKKSRVGRKTLDVLDIAIGGVKGSIHIYEDLLGKLIRNEQPTRNDTHEYITSRRLHWHRNAVLALKWSLDGNYLISGGQETVLVLWQLETGQKQDLPHLGAPIESIVVSPTGSSYGIRLADNSAMILSTSELRPTFSIAGIQTPSARKESGIDLPFTPCVSTPSQRIRSAPRSSFPACTSSSHPGCLLLAVPPSITSREPSTTPQNASYLQSFDIGAAHQISRQALSRTKITTLNMGPESNTIEEPNVTNMETSADGQWLATVDQWMPPKRDLALLAFDQERMDEEQTFRQEIYLKFWSWNDDVKVWELGSRIDNPHASQSRNPYDQGGVLELASDPSSTGFATVGADNVVKIWKPALRRRHGLDVRNKDGKSLMSWHCKHVVNLEFSQPHKTLSAKLAYSQDGSILIAGLQTSTPSPIYIIDAHGGEVQRVQTGLYSGPLLGLGIINKYLVTLSQELCVWDLVNDELNYGIKLQSHGSSLEKQIETSHLAVDIRHGLVAIALSETKHATQNVTLTRSQIALFNPSNATPLFQTFVPKIVTTLLPATGRKGFYAIDSAAEIRILTPTQTMPSVPGDLLQRQKTPLCGVSNIFGNGHGTNPIGDNESNQVGFLASRFDSVTQGLGIRKDDVAVVSQDRLAKIFDIGPAYTLPPVTELFEQVASLYGGREVT